jgi:hypothetical protein
MALLWSRDLLGVLMVEELMGMRIEEGSLLDKQEGSGEEWPWRWATRERGGTAKT